jgi:hypothetical protein
VLLTAANEIATIDASDVTTGASMNGWGERWWGAAGVVSAVLFLVGFALLGESGDTPQDVFEFYQDDTEKVIAFILLALSSLAYVVFVAALRDALATTRPEARGLARLGFGAGMVTAALLVVGAAPIAALSDAVGDVGAGAADTYYIVNSLSYPVLTVGIGISSLLALAAGLITLRTGVLPRWFGWVSVIASPIVLLAPLFVPIFVWLVWVAIAGVVLVLRPAVRDAGDGVTVAP